MFAKRTLGQRMAFGKIPAFCKYELYMERYRSAAEFARRELEGRESLSVLDIGSGRGRLKYFVDFNEHTDWQGIEVLDEMMSICSGIGYQMHKHDIEKEPIPFDDEAFDLVAGLHVLEHLSDPASVLRDMVRVLKPGGILVLGVPTKPPVIAELIGLYYSARQRLFPTDGRTCNAYSSPGFVRFAKQALAESCTVVDVRGFRLFSARKRLALEDLRWFYTISTWFGRCFPSLTPEINVIMKKRAR